MKQQKQPRFYFFKTLTYSLVLLASVILGFVIYTGVMLSQFASDQSHISDISPFHTIYLPILFIVILIADLFLILRFKIWAYYVFFFLMTLLVVLLFIQKPIDWLNILLILLIISIYGFVSRKVFRLKKSLDLEKTEETPIAE